MLLKDRKIILFLLIILALATFFRFWSLDSVPPGLYPDEAINGNDALSGFKLFYPENNGREGLFIWLLSFSFNVFGTGIIALRMVPALFGVLTVFGIYLLAKNLLERITDKAWAIGLISSFFLAVSFWHVNFSRIGFRAILVPFLLVFSFYFLNKSFQQKKWPLALVSGLFFGLGFYTYISYRFVIFLFLLNIIVWWFYSRKRIFFKILTASVAATLIISLPIGIYFLQNPQDFFGRASGVSVFSQDNPIYSLGKSFLLHMGIFNFYGDGNWRHNFAGSPQLLWFVGILFLIGFILSVKELVLGIKRKDGHRTSCHSLLLGWFFVFLLPGVLSYEGIPHALRVVGVIPAVYIFSGLGALWISERIKSFFKKKNRIFYWILIGILLFSITYSQFNKYFYSWAKREETQGAFSQDFVKMGRYINTSPSKVYVIVNKSGVPVPWPDGIPMPAQTVQFVERTDGLGLEAEYILPANLDRIKKDGRTALVLMGYDKNLIKKLEIKFPEGSLEEKEGFWVYNI